MAFITSFVLGVLLGGIAGYFYGGVIDRIFNWMVTMIFSLPFILIIVAITSAIERKSLLNAYLVLTCILWVSPARIVRTGVMQAKGSDFITFERAFGKPGWLIFLKSMLPVTLKPAFIFSFRYFPEIIGLEAGLSFLGLGVQPPQPGLGKMIFDGINYLSFAWWYAFFPAFLIFVLMALTNLLFAFMENHSYKSWR
jgi:peptide/nickel transport system permease protein